MSWGLTTFLHMQNSKRSGRNGKRGRRRKRTSASRKRSASDPPKAEAPWMASPTSLPKRRRARIIRRSVHTFRPSATPRQVVKCPLRTRAAWSRCTRLGMGRAIQGTPTHPTGRANRCTNHALRPKGSRKIYMLMLGLGPDLSP